MTLDDALAQLEALGDPEAALRVAAYHKAARRCLGVTVPQVAAPRSGAIERFGHRATRP